MARFDETQSNDQSGGEQATQGDTGLQDLLDAATSAAGQTGGAGPTDAGDLGRPGGESGALAGRDAANEGLDQDGGAATSGTDIGRGSS